MTDNALSVVTPDGEENTLSGESAFTEESTLTNLSGVLDGMTDPIPHADDISYLLEALYDGGADAGFLEEVQVNVGALVSTIRQYAQVAESLKALASKIREQRDEVRKEFDELHKGMRSIDRSNPAVEALYEQVEQITFSWVSETWYDDMIEAISDQIGEVVPLEYYEVASLINLLTDGSETLPREHPMWDELKSWVDRAEKFVVRMDGNDESEEDNRDQ